MTPAVPDPTVEAHPLALVLAEALHDQIDGDYLLMGTEDPGWDIGRVGISAANARDLVRWAVIATLPVVAAEVERAVEEAAVRVEAEIEDGGTSKFSDGLTWAARIVREGRR